MEAIERINDLYQKFIRYHARFSDTQYILPDAKVEYLRQMARASHQTLALCNPGRNDYHFLNLCCEEFSHLFTGVVTVDQFISAMHPDDLFHFMHAWEIAFQFMEGKSTDQLNDYSLMLECRMLDKNQQYQRVMFKYLMVEEYDFKRYGQALLFLKPIAGGKADQPSRGIYIINIANKELIYSERNNQISHRELEVLQYSQKGLTSDEIAEKMDIKPNTVNNHRCNILRKLSVRDNGFAVMYLRNMGVI